MLLIQRPLMWLMRIGAHWLVPISASRHPNVSVHLDYSHVLCLLQTSLKMLYW